MARWTSFGLALGLLCNCICVFVAGQPPATSQGTTTLVSGDALCEQDTLDHYKVLELANTALQVWDLSWSHADVALDVCYVATSAENKAFRFECGMDRVNLYVYYVGDCSEASFNERKALKLSFNAANYEKLRGGSCASTMDGSNFMSITVDVSKTKLPNCRAPTVTHAYASESKTCAHSAAVESTGGNPWDLSFNVTDLAVDTCHPATSALNKGFAFTCSKQKLILTIFSNSACTSPSIYVTFDSGGYAQLKKGECAKTMLNSDSDYSSVYIDGPSSALIFPECDMAPAVSTISSVASRKGSDCTAPFVGHWDLQFTEVAKESKCTPAIGVINKAFKINCFGDKIQLTVYKADDCSVGGSSKDQFTAVFDHSNYEKLWEGACAETIPDTGKVKSVQFTIDVPEGSEPPSMLSCHEKDEEEDINGTENAATTTPAPVRQWKEIGKGVCSTRENDKPGSYVVGSIASLEDCQDTCESFEWCAGISYNLEGEKCMAHVGADTCPGCECFRDLSSGEMQKGSCDECTCADAEIEKSSMARRIADIADSNETASPTAPTSLFVCHSYGFDSENMMQLDSASQMHPMALVLFIFAATAVGAIP